MRLGFLIYGSLETVSGGYFYDRKLVEYLRSQGDEVEIISIPWRSYARHLSDNLSAALYQRLLNLQVDVLLQDELIHPSLFWLNRRLVDKVVYPRVAIVHHLRSSEQRPAWQNRFYSVVERRYLKTLDGFIFNSQTTRQAVAQAGVDLGAVLWVIAYPSGSDFSVVVDEQHIRQRAVQAGPLCVVFVGNVIERKGLHTLLDALGRLPAGACRLDVIGSLAADPAYARQVQKQAAALGLEDAVCFHGSVDHPTMQATLNQAHVLAVPSSYEGYGIVYVEGMGFGLPAIAGSLGAAGEIITPGENGFLISPGSPVELAGVLQLLSTDRQRLAQMGITALHRFQLHPTWEDMGRGVRDFLLRSMITR
jgi:glycosyltransferase involved in cell wall biosynthesis